MGETRLEKIRIQRCRQPRSAIDLFLIAAAIREKEFVICAKVVVDSERHCGINYRDIGVKDEVVAFRVGWGVRMNAEEAENILGHCAQRGRDYISWKRKTTLLTTDGCSC